MNLLFAAEGAEKASEGLPLGLSASAFIIQLVTFIFVFMLLKKFAFKPITRILEKRRATIEDGVRLGQKLEKEREKLDGEVAKITREARHEADKIIAAGHKDARAAIHEAEKMAQVKANRILADAEERIVEETEHARRKLEKDIVGLVAEATEAVVGEKVDANKDAELIKKAMKGKK